MKKIFFLTIITTLLFLSLTTAIDNCHNPSADPIPLCTCDDLNKTSLDLTANYEIRNAIDCSGYTFTPIGAPSSTFGGTFDGQQYNISNLNINQEGTNYVGLFRYPYHANIQNVYITDATITATDYVGGLAGYARQSNITNCSVSGTISGGAQIGGLIGGFYDYTLINLSNSHGTVTGTGNNIGGLVGYGAPSGGYSYVTDSSSTATVSGVSGVGGLMGYFGSNWVGWSVSNCYATGDISSTGGTTGGLIGSDYRQHINNSYATGDITNTNNASGWAIGGLVGRASSTNVYNSYATGNVIALKETSGAYTVGGFIGALETAKVLNSYATGNVQGNYRVGGFIGTGSNNITNCFAKGNVSSAQSSTAGFIPRGSGNIYNSYSTGSVSSLSSSWKYSFVGDAQYSLTCKNSFYNNETTSLSTLCGATGKSAADLQNVATFTDVATSGLTGAWDFADNPNNDTGTADIWTFSSILNGAFPILRLVGYGLEIGSPITTLISPADNHAESSPPVDVTFNCSATDSSGLQNISLYLTDNTNNNLALNQTTEISGTSNSTSWTLTLNDGLYSWNCLTADNDSNTDWGTARTLNIDPTPPVTTLESPVTQFYNDSWDPILVTFNCSATDNVGLTSIDLYLTDSTNTSFIENQSTSVSGTSASASWTLNLSKGNYTWNCLTTDVANNINFSSNQSIRANFTDTTPPTFTGINNLTFVHQNAIEFTINSTDNYAFDTYTVNDTTNFAINSTGTLTNNTNLAVGFYNLQITINDSYNNNATALMWVNITPRPSISLEMVTPTGNINATQNQTFTVSVTVTCNGADCGEVNISLDPKQEETELGLDDVATIQSAITLYDNKSFTYDIQDGCDISDAQSDVFDGGLRMYIDNSEYTGTRSTTEDSGREAYCSEQSKSSLTISRKVYVPSDQNWARYLDILENPTGAEICVDVKVYQNMGSDGADYMNTSDGDTTWELTDYWMMWDDTSSTSGDDAAGFIYQHETGDETIDSRTPTTASGGYNQWIWEEVCIGAGETEILMYFFTQWDTRLQSETECNVIYENYLDEIYTEGMSTDEISQVVNWPMGGTSKSGLISNVVGDTPFYTETINPFNTTLTAGQSQTITWEVNATGQTNITHNFFIFANMTSDLTISNITAKWNVTIINETQGDTSAPVITFATTNNTFTTNTNLDINYSIIETNLSSCWYSYDSETTNYSLSSCENITDLAWSEGEHTLTVWANDSVNEGKNTITFTIDLTNPTITFITTDETSTDNPSLDINYNANDTNLDSCWYSNDSMSINTTLNNCANITGNAWSQGEHTLTVWANDSANNQNSASITFTIEDSNPRINLISPTPNNNTFTTNQNILINTSIIDQNINNIIYNWQRTNYTIYNDSLVLMLNFDNISSLGENSTSIIDFAKQNNGTAIGGANYNSSGRYGGCYNFDGTDDYIQIADNSNLDVNTITLSAWVNLASWDEGGSIITKGTGGGGEVWSLDVTGNKYRFYFWKSGTPYVLDSLTTPSGWQHITATYDGTEMEFYINGNLTNSNTVSQGNLDNNDHIISIGSRQSGSGSYDLNVNGQIDEIRIWDSGLNESEVYQQYISNLNRYNSSQWYLYINQSKNTTNLLDEGTYTYNVFAIDRSNNQNKTNIQTITIDTTFPQITISSPTNNTFSNNANLNINYTIVETNIDSCWYSNDSMSKNTTLTNCANITNIIWSEGQHNVTIWTNDSVNQVNKTSTSFNIDSNTPLISITSPNNNTFSNNANLNINYTIVETNIGSCWYSNDSMSKNTTLTNCANITDITWSEGQHNVTIWTNDSSNRINRTSVTFSIDTIFPQISITYPTNNSNLTNYNTDINYSVTDTNLDSCWYSNDSMSKNTTLTNCANITTIIWNIGQHNVTIWTNDSVNQVNKSSITFTILEDKDQDGTEDINDSLEYNETYVIKEGITKLNITVGGNSTNNTYTEKHEVRFYDQNTLLLNFSHNFSQSEIDLSKVRITKTSTALIVNFSGQLQENKTLFITDNDFVSLCVKDQEISSVSEISSSCTGANETDFTSCLGSQTRINSINCTDLGDTIKVENLQHSGILGTQATPVESPPSSSSGGSGGGGSNSISTAYGSDNETEEKECYSNADCSSDYHCYENECVKLFDIKILNASVIDGHLHFTYFVKGMAVFNNDITIKFWLTKDGMNYTEGQDVIYLGEYEEKTETTKLYLPSELEKGTYKFYIETSFEDYSATSYRTLELEKEGEEFIATLAPETTLTSDWINLIIVALLTLFIITITRLTNPKDWIINKIKQIKIPKIKISKIKVPKTKKAPIKVKVKPKTEKNALVKGLLKEILKPKTEEPNLTKALLKEILKKK